MFRHDVCPEIPQLVLKRLNKWSIGLTNVVLVVLALTAAEPERATQNNERGNMMQGK